MDVLDHTAAISPDDRSVFFTLSAGDHPIEGVIDRSVLEEYFWLPANADAARTLRTFEDGRERIVAVARRKWLAHRNAAVRLGAPDFVIR
ncbi:hypothetical protein P3T18_001128 [Paraburkholderia sp. GAS199]|uniref:DUF1488 family protein n=1 Tax=Paraburkholderia sp. GAS199 TaxID=3035126 RepID=UPI003D24A92F